MITSNLHKMCLHDAAQEKFFGEDANDEEMLYVRPAANDHDAGGSDKGVIELSSNED